MDKKQWQSHVNKHKTSGLSKSAYAKKNGLVYDNFIYWARKLSKQSESAFVPVKVTASTTAKLKTESTFPSTDKAPKSLGVLEYPNGTRLIIHSPDLIAQLPLLLKEHI